MSSVRLNSVMLSGNQADTHAVDAVTSFSTNGIFIQDGPKRMLVAVLNWGQGSGGTAVPGSRSVTWGGVAMTERAFVSSGGGVQVSSVGIYTLADPSPGAKALAATWTNALDCYASAICFDGVSSVGATATDVDGLTINIAGFLRGATVATHLRNGDEPNTTQTKFWGHAALDPGGAGSYELGNVGTVTHDFNSGANLGTERATAAISLLPATGGTLRLHESLPEFVSANSEQDASGDDEMETPAFLSDGRNRVLIGAMGWSAGAPPAFSEMRWGGSGGTLLTQIGSTISNGNQRLAIGYLINPALGSATLYGLLASVSDEKTLGGMIFQNCHQTSPIGQVRSLTSTAASPQTITLPVTPGVASIIVGHGFAGDASGSSSVATNAVNLGATERWSEENVGSAPFVSAVGYTLPPQAINVHTGLTGVGQIPSVTFTWTGAGSPQGIHVALALNGFILPRYFRRRRTSRDGLGLHGSLEMRRWF